MIYGSVALAPPPQGGDLVRIDATDIRPSQIFRRGAGFPRQCPNFPDHWVPGYRIHRPNDRENLDIDTEILRRVEKFDQSSSLWGGGS